MENVIQVLQTAIEMEHRGHQFYVDASRQAKDPVIRSVLVALAHDEEEHENIITRFYRALERGQGWPSTESAPEVKPASERMSEILDDSDTNFDVGYLETYERALDFEVKTRDFYKAQMEEVANPPVVSFFQFLVHLEQAHVGMLEMLIESTKRV
ncbi:MAG: ferritin family protein [Armatimonadota bacterium]